MLLDMSVEKAAPDDAYVITLGTAGGPRWWRQHGRVRAGISTAVVVGEGVYLVDCGYGAVGQLARAGFPLSAVRAVFLTHLHSDHVVDLAALASFGVMNLNDRSAPVHIFGPGNRQLLPPLSSRADGPVRVLFADDPTPGTSEMFDALLRGFGTDLADRMFDSLRPSPREFLHVHDIDLPPELAFHANDNPTPDMEPFAVYEDERVRVSATLVEHPPVAPAFAFRLDTASGSVTISGDTAPCDNLVQLAGGTDLLLHEAIDLDAIRRQYDGVPDETVAATMDHHRKAHTTPEQAGDIAQRSGARQLALHHLVPGSAEPHVWLRAKETYDGRLLVPDDLELIDLNPANH